MNKIDVLDKGYVELIDHMGDDSSVVRAARQSVNKSELGTLEEQKEFIADLMRWEHMTPFEFCTFTFRIKAPIFIYRQWHRSRTQSYLEKSARYTKIDPEYYEPDDAVFTPQNPSTGSPPITINSCKNKNDWISSLLEIEDSDWSWKEIFQNEQKMAHNQYSRLIGTGVRKELARINSPVSQYSEMYMAVDLRNLFHFLNLRLNQHAQWEIRQYAEAIFTLLKDVVPYSCEAFEEYVLGSVKFSKKEMTEIRNLFEDVLATSSDGLVLGDIIGKSLNEKENKEFLKKIKK